MRWQIVVLFLDQDNKKAATRVDVANPLAIISLIANTFNNPTITKIDSIRIVPAK